MNQQHLDLYQKLSEKYNLPVDKIKKVVQHQFEFTRQQIKEGNEVLLHNFGSFEILKHNVYGKLKNLINSYRNKKIEKEYFEKEFKNYWRVKQKL